MPPRAAARVGGTAGEGDSLILTPSKLRLQSYVFGPYITILWLPNALLAVLLVFKLAHQSPMPWWLVFMPQWLGHAGHLVLVAVVLLAVDKLVLQQLGPAPPGSASPGMLLQYATMFRDRRLSLVIDNICSLVEHTAALVVKVAVCRALTANTLSSPNFCWRLLLLPCWVAWAVTFALSLCKPRKERTFGSMRDLLYISLLFVALKLDGLAAYTWSVVFLIPWMWFGALFLGAIATAGVILVAYACMDLRELALPGGFLLLLLSASAQLPCFIFLCNYLDGDAGVTMQEILLPQVASWLAMWASGLVICWGLRKKEQLRARLAASGQVWTAHEGAARELMSLELEDMQHQVDKMSNEQLAEVAMRMMEGKAQPQQLLRVGSTLYRRALSFTAMASPRAVSMLMRLEGDGTAQLSELSGSDAMEQGQAWSSGSAVTSPSREHPPTSRMSAEGTVCVDVQLVLPPGLRAAAADGKAGQQQGSSGRAAEAADGSSKAATPLHAAAAAAAAARCKTPPALAAAATAAAAVTALDASDDDGVCTICYDAPATCVLMECGHGGYCWRCAHVLFARPPSECPVCRQSIMQVLELEDPRGQVGRPVRVKQLSKSGSGCSSSSGGGGWFK